MDCGPSNWQPEMKPLGLGMLLAFWAALGLLNMGDIDAARPHAFCLRELADRRSTPRLLAGNSIWVFTSLSCLEGDWKAGRESSDRGLEVSPLNPILLAARVLLEHETGESAQGGVYLERLIETVRLPGGRINCRRLPGRLWAYPQ